MGTIKTAIFEWIKNKVHAVFYKKNNYLILLCVTINKSETGIILNV